MTSGSETTSAATLLESKVVLGHFLNVGCSDFSHRRRQNCCFVDKSMFIGEVVDSKTRVNIIVRPDGFGKSMNLSMLRTFYEIDNKDANRECLIDLLIYKHRPDLFEASGPFGRHPVIYLDLQMVDETKWMTLLRDIHRAISQLYIQFDYVLNNHKIDENMKSLYKWIYKQNSCNYDFLVGSLEKLSTCVARYHNSPCVILIDNFTSPLEYASDGADFEDIHQFLKSFLLNLIRCNDESVLKVVIMEAIPVSVSFSENDRTALYDWRSAEYSNHFGFTTAEVDQLLRHYRPNFKPRDKLFYWYGGYHTADSGPSMCNPKSILNICQDRQEHWTKAGQVLPDILSSRSRSEIQRKVTEVVPDRFFKDLVFRLLSKRLSSGATDDGPDHHRPHDVYIEIDDSVRFDASMQSRYNSPPPVWSLLYHMGYLVSQVRDRYYIPTIEIALLYLHCVVDRKVKFDQIVQHLLNGEFEQLQTQLVAFGNTFTHIDYDPDWKNNYYHILALGLLGVSSKFGCILNIDAHACSLVLVPETAAPDGSCRGSIVDMNIVDFANVDEAAVIALQAEGKKSYFVRCPNVNEAYHVGVGVNKTNCSVVGHSVTKIQMGRGWIIEKPYRPELVKRYCFNVCP